MALINCPECGHQMSDTANGCPNCGYIIKSDVKKDVTSKWISIIGIFGILNFVVSVSCLFVQANHYPYGISLMCGLIAIYVYLIANKTLPISKRHWAFVLWTVGYNVLLYLAIHIGRNIGDFDEYFLYRFGNIIYLVIFTIWIYVNSTKSKNRGLGIRLGIMLIMVALPLIRSYTHTFRPLEKAIWYNDSSNTITSVEGSASTNSNQVENEYNNEFAKIGFEYIKKNLTDKNITLNRFQFMDNKGCSVEESPIKNFEDISMGFFDCSGPKLGSEQIWVFFKKKEPRLLWIDNLMEGDFRLYLMAAWDDRTDEQRKLDKTKENALLEYKIEQELLNIK